MVFRLYYAHSKNRDGDHECDPVWVPEDEDPWEAARDELAGCGLRIFDVQATNDVRENWA